jgi:hypothetical protein
LTVGEQKRRRATRAEKRSAILRRRFGGAAFDLHIFPLTAIEPPKSEADLPLALWRLQIGLGTLERQKRGELYCFLCDGVVALGPPPLVGFIMADDPNPELCGFAVCEACASAADSFEQIKEMVGEAFGGVVAPLCRH